jgi:hypothetical protein
MLLALVGVWLRYTRPVHRKGGLLSVYGHALPVTRYLYRDETSAQAGMSTKRIHAYGFDNEQINRMAARLQ